jgi:hypothetical protein
MSSWFVHVTSVPAAISMVAGVNAKLLIVTRFATAGLAMGLAAGLACGLGVATTAGVPAVEAWLDVARSATAAPKKAVMPASPASSQRREARVSGPVRGAPCSIIELPS